MEKREEGKKGGEGLGLDQGEQSEREEEKKEKKPFSERDQQGKMTEEEEER